MKIKNPADPFQDPTYMRTTSDRLCSIIADLSDPGIKRSLAEHSFILAQRAEAIARLIQDDFILHSNAERDPSILNSKEFTDTDGHVPEGQLTEPEQALNGDQTLRQLAAWYREFAEKAGDPGIWDARLRMADDLDAEADRIDRGHRSSDRGE